MQVQNDFQHLWMNYILLTFPNHHIMSKRHWPQDNAWVFYDWDTLKQTIFWLDLRNTVSCNHKTWRTCTLAQHLNSLEKFIHHADNWTQWTGWSHHQMCLWKRYKEMATLVTKTVVMRSCVFRKWVEKRDFFPHLSEIRIKRLCGKSSWSNAWHTINTC